MLDITLDFETHFSTEYSLRKMPQLLYVRDPRFKVHGCAIKRGDGKSKWVTGSVLATHLWSIDWAKAQVISHNALFDMLVLFEKYRINAARYVDTLGLCRALLPPDLDLDLGSIAPLLGLGHKGKELESAKGLIDLPPEIEAAIAGYAENDADLAYGIYTALYGHLPEQERILMDMTIRMGTQGVLRVNRALAQRGVDRIVDDRDNQLRKLGVTMKALRSRDQFAEMLRARGVEPPTKLNAKGETTFAFSKQDPAFVKLQSDQRVADLVRARLAVSSNNAITRAQNFIAITDLPPHTLPMPLNYWGAHTGRWSGAGGLNVQNLNRGGGLRESIEAPPGHMVVVADSAQIELRSNMWFSGQIDVLDVLRSGGDVYKKEAAAQFSIPYARVDKKQRNMGKVVQLAAGYNMGWPKFQTQCAVGIMGNPPMYLSDEEAQNIIYTYRRNNHHVKDSWDRLQVWIIPAMSRTDTNFEYKHLLIKHEAIVLPGGMELQYPNLHPASETDWAFGLNGDRKIYGGLLQENIVQATARKIIADQMIDVQEFYDDWLWPQGLMRPGEIARVVSQTHDEIISIVPTRLADFALRYKLAVMSESPEWAPDLPLSADGGYAHNYSK